jgi:hypothetical protein
LCFSLPLTSPLPLFLPRSNLLLVTHPTFFPAHSGSIVRLPTTQEPRDPLSRIDLVRPRHSPNTVSTGRAANQDDIHDIHISLPRASQDGASGPKTSLVAPTAFFATPSVPDLLIASLVSRDGRRRRRTRRWWTAETPRSTEEVPLVLRQRRGYDLCARVGLVLLAPLLGQEAPRRSPA